MRLCQDSTNPPSRFRHSDHVVGSHAPLNAHSQVLTRELISDVTDLPATSSRDYSEQPSHNKRSKTQTPPEYRIKSMIPIEK